MDYNSTYQGSHSFQTPFTSQLLLKKPTLENDISLNGLNHLIKQMNNEKTFSNRLMQAKSFSSFLLGGLSNNFYHPSVISIISILSDWVRDVKYELKASYTKERLTEIELFMSIILSVCQYCPLTFSDLKTTKIGKSINKFAKNLPESSYIKSGCLDIVAKWRRLNDGPSSSLAMLYKNGYGSAYWNGSEQVCLGKKTTRSQDESAFEKNTINKDNSMKVPNGDRKNLQASNMTKKSCIKNKKEKHLSNKQVKFANDLAIKQTKIFRVLDEPNAPGVSNDEYLKIQQELQSNPNKFKLRHCDIREKDMKMDKPIKIKGPMTGWRPLQPLTSSRKEPKCNNSLESKEIEDYCSHILSATYFNSIPEPKEGKCIFFPYEDEAIPKIDNIKKVSQEIQSPPRTILFTSASPLISLLNYIESFDGKELKLKELQEIYTRLETITDVPQEKKLIIIKGLCTRINQSEIAEVVNNYKQKQQNEYQYHLLQDNSKIMNQVTYSIPPFTNTNSSTSNNTNSNNNNTTHDSYNSTDSIDIQEKQKNNNMNMHFNDKIKNMFNDKRRKQPNHFYHTNSSSNNNNKHVRSPLHFPFNQQVLPQQQQMTKSILVTKKPPLLYHNNITNYNHKLSLNKNTNKVASNKPHFHSQSH